MAFTVEDGTIVADANAYASVAAFEAWHDDRGQDYSAYTDAQVQEAIVRATTYIDASYTFKGIIVDDDQTLSWPRYNVFDKNDRAIAANVVPAAVIGATSELAFYALANALTVIIKPDDKVKRVKAGSAEVEYMDGAKTSTITFDYVNRLLSGLLAGGSSGVGYTNRGW